MKRDFGFDLFMEASAKTGFNAKNVIKKKLFLDLHWSCQNSLYRIP